MPRTFSRRALIAGTMLAGAAAGTGIAVAVSEAEDVEVAVTLPVVGPVTGNQLHVMSYNLRVAVDSGARSWDSRRPKIAKLLKQERPSILGTQEGRLHQIKDLKADLAGFGCVYLGREADGTGETTAVFFDKKRLEKLNSGHKWLSNTPNKQGSKSWGNKFPRMFTWVEFRDKNSGKTFVHLNTHFDHVSENSRRKSATMVRNWVRGHGLPAVITGDFNTGDKSQPYKTLTKGGFHDTWFPAKHRLTPHFGTANGWKPAPVKKGRRIDWILGTGKVAVAKSGINTWVPANKKVPSDHWPVHAVVTIG